MKSILCIIAICLICLVNISEEKSLPSLNIVQMPSVKRKIGKKDEVAKKLTKQFKKDIVKNLKYSPDFSALYPAPYADRYYPATHNPKPATYATDSYAYSTPCPQTYSSSFSSPNPASYSASPYTAPSYSLSYSDPYSDSYQATYHKNPYSAPSYYYQHQPYQASYTDSSYSFPSYLAPPVIILNFESDQQELIPIIKNSNDVIAKLVNEINMRSNPFLNQKEPSTTPSTPTSTKPNSTEPTTTQSLASKKLKPNKTTTTPSTPTSTKPNPTEPTTTKSLASKKLKPNKTTPKLKTTPTQKKRRSLLLYQYLRLLRHFLRARAPLNAFIPMLPFTDLSFSALNSVPLFTAPNSVPSFSASNSVPSFPAQNSVQSY